jgi:hypothetical protein
MNRKHLLSAGFGAAVIALASQANATTVTFESFGGAYPLYNIPAGDQLYTNFSSGLPAGAVGDGALYGPNYGVAGPAAPVSPRASFLRSFPGRLKPSPSATPRVT